MIGMSMRFQNPIHGELLLRYKFNQPVGTAGGGSARLGVVIQHGIDQRSMAPLLIKQDITDRECILIKKSFNPGLRHIILRLKICCTNIIYKTIICQK